MGFALLCLINTGKKNWRPATLYFHFSEPFSDPKTREFQLSELAPKRTSQSPKAVSAARPDSFPSGFKPYTVQKKYRWWRHSSRSASSESFCEAEFREFQSFEYTENWLSQILRNCTQSSQSDCNTTLSDPTPTEKSNRWSSEQKSPVLLRFLI